MRDLFKQTEAAARALRIQLRFAEMRRPEELERAFSTILREPPDALVVFPSPMLFTERARIVALAANDRVTLFTDLYAFYLDHRRCGDLTGDVEASRPRPACGSYVDNGWWLLEPQN
jgi:hypothetical protein